jgi:hypothetical protein
MEIILTSYNLLENASDDDGKNNNGIDIKNSVDDM